MFFPFFSTWQSSISPYISESAVLETEENMPLGILPWLSRAHAWFLWCLVPIFIPILTFLLMHHPIKMLLLKLCVQFEHHAWPWIWPQNLLHLPVSEDWVKSNSETNALPFGWGRWTGYTSPFKPRRLAQLIAQCWQQGVLTKVKFIGWMKNKKRGERGGSVPWWDTPPSTHRRYFRAMFYAHLWEAANKNNPHVHLAWPLCILLHRKQTHRFF